MMAGRLKYRIVVEHIGGKEVSPTGFERVEKTSFPTRADVRWGSIQRKDAEAENLYECDVTFMVWAYLRKRINLYDTIIYEGRRFVIVSAEPEPDSKILYLKARAE